MNRNYEIKKLAARHHEILRLAVLGYKGKKIAELVGTTPQTVYNILGTPLAKRQVEMMQGKRDESVDDVAVRLRGLEPLAVDVLEDTLLGTNGSKAGEQLRASLAILTEIGDHAAASKVQVTHAHLSSDQIEELKRRARQAGYAKESIEETDYEEVSDSDSNYPVAVNM